MRDRKLSVKRVRKIVMLAAFPFCVYYGAKFLVLALNPVFWPYVFSRGATPETDLEEASERIRIASTNIDPEELREWALKQIASSSSTTNDSSRISVPDRFAALFVPEPKNYEKNYAFRLRGKALIVFQHKEFVFIPNQIGIEQKGFAVGPTNFVVEAQTAVRWRPGIYYTIDRN